MRKSVLWFAILCIWKVDSFADTYSVINLKDTPIQVFVKTAETHDVVRLFVSTRGGTELGGVLAEDGNVKDKTPINIPSKHGVLLKTLYNYNGGKNPVLEIKQDDSSSETVQVELSSTPITQQFETIQVTQDSCRRFKSLPVDSTELLSITSQSDNVVIVEQKR